MITEIGILEACWKPVRTHFFSLEESYPVEAGNEGVREAEFKRVKALYKKQLRLLMLAKNEIDCQSKYRG